MINETIDIDKKYHGHIVGKSGVNIKRIKEEYNVRILVPSAQDQSNRILIRGTAEAVAAAKRQVMAVIHEIVSRTQEPTTPYVPPMDDDQPAENMFSSLEEYFASLRCFDNNEEEEEVGFPCTSCIGRGQSRPKISTLKLPSGAFMAPAESKLAGRSTGRGRARRHPEQNHQPQVGRHPMNFSRSPSQTGSKSSVEPSHFACEPPLDTAGNIHSYLAASKPSTDEGSKMIDRQEIHQADTKPRDQIFQTNEPETQIPNPNFVDQWLSSHFSSDTSSKPRFTQGLQESKPQKKTPSVNDFLDCMDDLSSGGTFHRKKSKLKDLPDTNRLKSLPARIFNGTGNSQSASSFSSVEKENVECKEHVEDFPPLPTRESGAQTTDKSGNSMNTQSLRSISETVKERKLSNKNDQDLNNATREPRETDLDAIFNTVNKTEEVEKSSSSNSLVCMKNNKEVDAMSPKHATNANHEAESKNDLENTQINEYHNKTEIISENNSNVNSPLHEYFEGLDDTEACDTKDINPQHDSEHRLKEKSQTKETLSDPATPAEKNSSVTLSSSKPTIEQNAEENSSVTSSSNKPSIEQKEDSNADEKADDSLDLLAARECTVEERTLVVYDLPESCTVEFLIQYLMSFGDVESCDMQGLTAEVVFTEEQQCDWAVACVDGGIDGLFPDHPDLVVKGYRKSDGKPDSP